RHDLPDLIDVDDVGGLGHMGTAGLAERRRARFEAIGVIVDDHEGRARLREALRHHVADRATGTRDQHRTIVESQPVDDHACLPNRTLVAWATARLYISSDGARAALRSGKPGPSGVPLRETQGEFSVTSDISVIDRF